MSQSPSSPTSSSPTDSSTNSPSEEQAPAVLPAPENDEQYGRPHYASSDSYTKQSGSSRPGRQASISSTAGFYHLPTSYSSSSNLSGQQFYPSDLPLESEPVSRKDKLAGRLTTLLGKLTNDPAKVLEGQVRSEGALVALRGEGPRAEIE